MSFQLKPKPPKPKSRVKRAGKMLTAVKPKGFGTMTARPQAFAAQVAEFAKKAGAVGFKALSPQSNWPFTDKTQKDAARRYDPVAQSFIVLALKYRGRGVVISGNQGTLPELVLLGAHLARPFFRLGVNLWHQSVALYGLRARDRAFIVDVAAEYCGVRWLYPVDGEYFHLKSMTEVLDSQKRNWELEAMGMVLPVTDVQCYDGVGLLMFLRSHGAPV